MSLSSTVVIASLYFLSVGSEISVDERSSLIQSSQCNVCEFVISSLDTTLTSSIFQHGAEDLIEFEVCTKAVAMVQPCRAFVKDVISKIFVYLSSKLQAQLLCDEANLCESPSLQAPLQDSSLLQVSQSIESENNNGVLRELSVLQLACSYCQFLGDALINGKTCNQTCAQFPLSNECKTFCMKDLEPIVARETSSVDACMQLSVCSSSIVLQQQSQQMHSEEELGTSADVQKGFETKDSQDCELCKQIVVQFQNYILKQKTRIKQVANLLCDSLWYNSETCHMIVNQYLDKIFDAIIGYLDPASVCEHLGQCPPETWMYNMREM
eukprot:TRINITY_DN1435_c0_g1_i2.p1 TRINITY_DN1435_c0_g1~~TRINITY_DN1435_c0_g1_i2.p1  ORF type:complete len:359 (-),score=3.00 TRINITY_DN1435_c0_g1_i2:433-1407(-)